ncbi:MAG: hypothetical protein OXR64_09730 [Chloroflexota bacterium]|nr:hypothetical protein [Chloroflexota bacterium]MDE2920111.1 hypothetical protein [Chloroflexota bacterium]
MRYRLLAGLVLVSAASLLFEIALTRVYAIAQGHHFAFVAIAMALLGIGAAGTLTATSARVARATPQSAISWAGALFALTALGAYVTADRIPLDTYRIGADASQLGWLALFFIVAAVPFTCAGVAVVTALRHSPAGAGTTYGASLAGSAAGAALAVPLLGLVGSAATILLAAALAMAAPLLLASRLPATIAGLTGLGLIAMAVLVAPAGPRVSVHSQLAQALQRPDAHRLDTKLSSNSRVDILKNAGFRTATGLSLNYQGSVPRPQIGVTVDGGNAAALDVPLTEALDHVPLAHAITVRPAASALLLDPIGAFDTAVVLRAGIDEIDLVQPDAALRQAWHDAGNDTVLNDDRVRTLDQGVRSALRSAAGYDLVIWPLRESFQGVAAGTFGLRETYALTRDALADGRRALAPSGRLVITRWLQATPSESVRMWASLLGALRQSGITDPAPHVLAWRSLEVVTMVASPTAFTPAERQALTSGFERDGFDWVFHANLDEADSNRFNRLPDTLLFRAFQAVVSGESTRATWAPVTDDRPYFFHYFDWTLWREVLSTTGRTWQPFGGAGFLVLVPLASAATGAAVLTMIAPLMGRRRRGASHLGLRRLAFVAAAGVAFTATQIALLQRLILVLDAPTVAFATGIAAMLAWAGLGSLSSRWWRPHPRTAALMAAMSVFLLGGLLLAAPLALGAPLAVRLAAAVLAASPSLALGTVMPAAIRALADDRSAISWAWAVNGTASVAAAFVAAILIVSIGFAWTLLAAALAYAVAVPLWRARDPRLTSPR